MNKPPDNEPPQESGTLFDSVDHTPDPVAPAPALEPEDDLGAIFEASRQLARSDRSDAEAIRLKRGFEPILDALNNDLPDNQKFLSPHLWLNMGGGLNSSNGILRKRPSRQESWLDPSSWVRDRVTVRDQMNRIFDEIGRRRKTDPKFLPGIPDTWQEYRRQLIEEEKKARQRARSTLGRSQGALATVVSFGGSARELITDPINVAAMPLGLGLGAGKPLLTIAAREALIGGAVELAQQPIIADNREVLDEELTLQESAFLVGTSAAFSGAVPIVLRGAGKAIGATQDATARTLFNLMPESAQRRWASKMTIDDMSIEDFYGSLSHRETADFTEDLLGSSNLTPEQRAAVNTLRSQEEVGAASPYRDGPDGDAEHAARLSDALNKILDESRPPVAKATPIRPKVKAGTSGGQSAALAGARARPGGATSAPPATRASAPVNRSAVKAAIRVPESSGNDQARNLAGSSASGRYQFIRSTFIDLYAREYGVSSSQARSVWNSKKRFDVDIQERLMDRLLDENGAALRRARLPETTGNLYLAHFAGVGRAIKLLRADPGAPVSRFFNRQEVAQNQSYLGGGKTVGEALNKIFSVVGDRKSLPVSRNGGGSSPSLEADPKIAALRSEAMRLQEQAIGERPLPAGGTLPAMRSMEVDANKIAIDAETFQFKSGGDEFGVTERLRGVSEWNPVFAGRVVLWEDGAGKLFVADGHQRVGLANRLSEESGTQIRMDAIVLRSADGVTAENARTWAALKNIAEGSGSRTDVAKVIRDVGPGVIENLPPQSALARDGAALARLSDDAFGKVYNEVIPADIAAVVGHVVPDRTDAHDALVDLLVRVDPPNRGQAESVVRQAVADGFHRGKQEDLFGLAEVTRTLYLERAKVLERGLAGLRKLRGAFTVASKNAGALEQAGSKIAITRAQEEAARNAQAIEIVSRLAFSRDNPVSEALNIAAERLAGGAALRDVSAEFVEQVRKLRIEQLSGTRTGDSGRLAPDGAGRGGDAGTQGDGAARDGAEPGQPSLGELESATQRHSDPDSQVMRDQADSLTHDLKVDLERAGRDGAELDLENMTFRLGEEGEEIAAKDLLAELDADDAAVATIKGCL